jgi:hypothetical protein
MSCFKLTPAVLLAAVLAKRSQPTIHPPPGPLKNHHKTRDVLICSASNVSDACHKKTRTSPSRGTPAVSPKQSAWLFVLGEEVPTPKIEAARASATWRGSLIASPKEYKPIRSCKFPDSMRALAVSCFLRLEKIRRRN